MCIFFEAQTKYEFATLRYLESAGASLKELTGLTLTTKDVIQVINNKPKNPYVELEKKASELSAEGWEVFQVTSSGQGAWYSYHLRRKID